jgi:hypothetical protein
MTALPDKTEMKRYVKAACKSDSALIEKLEQYVEYAKVYHMSGEFYQTAYVNLKAGMPVAHALRAASLVLWGEV